jgi:hypothetical protein
MKTSIMAAVATAVAFSSEAGAHEFACEKTIDGAVVREVVAYPATLRVKITLTNTHPVHQSTALRLRDGLLETLGLQFTRPPPFTLEVGESAVFEYDVPVRDRAECVKLSRVQACTATFSDAFQVVFDGGAVQCAARIVCGP